MIESNICNKNQDYFISATYKAIHVNTELYIKLAVLITTEQLYLLGLVKTLWEEL